MYVAPMTQTPHRSKRDPSLSALEDIKPLYFLPADNLVGEVLIPCFRIAETADCMMGFFSSEALAALAPGLAAFISDSSGTLRLVVSPYLRPADQAALDEGLRSTESLVAEVLERLIITEDLLQQHTLKCLAHLVRIGRIEFRVAIMRGALFHPKVWIFNSGGQTLAVHGSSNMTLSGIRRNFEQITISRSWTNATELYVIDKLAFQFRRLWEDKEDDCAVVTLPAAFKEKLLQTYPTKSPPTADDFDALYQRAKSPAETEGTLSRPAYQRGNFAIPPSLKSDDGPFAHQGAAASAWCDAGYRGILEMATGSGKTITAMIGAHRLAREHRPLLIVIAAPYVPLVEQWCDEVGAFGLKPQNLTRLAGASERAQELQRIRRRLRLNDKGVEAVVVSHDTLCTKEFQDVLTVFECERLLIADEVHNLGRESFVMAPPEFFEYRLGLSATPVRQYDDAGTKALSAFFGPIVFRFPLEDAIGRCLVEYDYYLHPVRLSQTEMERWSELTEKIRQNAWRLQAGEPDDFLTKLFRDRRELLETASGKIDALRRALGTEDLRRMRHTLIYASDKSPEQLEDVNRLLNESGVLFHQLTAEETGDREKTRRIIHSFRDGEIQVLTAKRVLDEGVNIPEIETAFILASTTVERQWIQRRGRLLRMSPSTGKTHSVIHDFLALPPHVDGRLDQDARKVIQSELRRVQAFSRLARNAGRPDGPLAVITQLVDAAFIDS
jgi:superfamily II DNA or RNA helicase